MANVIGLIILFCLSCCPFAYCEDVELPQGNNVSIDIFQRLITAHEVAVNQKSLEDLFLSLPLVPPDQDDSVTVANTSASVSTPPKIRHREIGAETRLSANHDKRQISCNTRLSYEGQDPCEGREKELGFVRCDQPCKYTLDVGQIQT